MRKQIIIGIAALIVIAATVLVLLLINPDKNTERSADRQNKETEKVTADQADGQEAVDAPVLIEDEGDIVIIIPDDMEMDGF